MELDHFVHKIQSVLKKEQRTLGTLDSLKRDKEEDIAKVICSLSDVVQDEEFNNKMKQRLYVLLFLNTDTNVYRELKKNRKYTHLVGFLPKLSRDLFINIVVSLQLHQFLYESVQHFCSSLSYQVLDISANALNWLDLFDTINFVECVLTSLFSKIIAIDEKDKYNIHLKDVFQRLLLHYDVEKGGNINRMRLWKSHKLKHYAGLLVTSLLSLVQKCTKIYCNKEDESSTVDRTLYDIQIVEDSGKVKRVAGIENRPITRQQCYQQVVARCLENVSPITIELWLFWIEIDLDDIPDTENTLQRLVGEQAYYCQESLREAESMGISSKETCDLISRLKNFVLKPRSEEDVAGTLDLEQMLKNIQDPTKNSHTWLKYLLNSPLFSVEPATLEVIKIHVSNLPLSDVLKLSKHLFTFINISEKCAFHKNFVLEMVQSIDQDYQIEVAKYFVQHFGVSEILKTAGFQTLFVDTFNKVINEEDKEKELQPFFLILAMQSAEAVINHAVAQGITSEVRGHLMAEILSRLQVFCDAVNASNSKPLLVVALDKLMQNLPNMLECHRINYPLFVRELVMRKNLDGHQFINGCLMPRLHAHLVSKDWVVLAACLETLVELYDIDCIGDCAVTVVMLLQVVQTSRWSPLTFNVDAVKVCELALQLVAQFVTKLSDVSIEAEYLKKLDSLVHKLISPLNRYHLYRLLVDEKLPTDPALQLVYRMHYGVGEWSVLQVEAEDRTKLVYSLCYVLPILTSNEWHELFCVTAPKCSEFLALFHVVTDSILLCLNSAKLNSDPAAINCLKYAIVNVTQVVKYEVNRWTKDDNEYRISVLAKLCQLVCGLPHDEQESFGLTLIKVLQQLLPEGSRRKPLTDAEMNVVTASIASIPAPTVRQNLSKEFLEMIHR